MFKHLLHSRVVGVEIQLFLSHRHLEHGKRNRYLKANYST